MITPMKRLVLLTLPMDRDRTLARLRELGVVHVTHARTPRSESLEWASSHLDFVRRALSELPDDPAAKPSGQPVRKVIDTIWKLIEQRDALTNERKQLRTERERIAVFGDFDPDAARQLAEDGVHVLLYGARADEVRRAGGLEAFVHNGVPRRFAQAGERPLVVEHGREQSTLYFSLITRIPPDAFILPEARRVELPQQSLGRLDEHLTQLDEQLRSIDEHLALYAGDKPAVAAVLDDVRAEVRFAEVSAGMATKGPVLVLTGYFPAARSFDIEQAAAENDWGIRITDPDDPEQVPTHMENPAWVRPIGAVFDAIGITPAYDGVDISPVFLLFLSIFFAILVGDAGYGALFVLLTAGVRVLMPQVPTHVTRLLYIMSGSTIVWGLLTGTFFGMQNPPAFATALKLEWLTGAGSEANVMFLCFLIGAVHLTIAHAWNAIRLWPDMRALAQIGWIPVIWVMFFAARTMVLLQPFPMWLLWVLGAGLALVLAFMVPLSRIRQEWFNLAMFPLTLIGAFVDVVSYVRLFAVGAATFAVASAFNSMAADMGAGVLAGVAGALIVFLGHGLNILLAGMGVLVHGVRLNTLEFAGHLDLSWSGIAYNPFRKRSAPADD